ncbi:MAG: mandelate racemase/muconate lactonizing enzyme family protein [Desulfocapsaceae bacterium]
MAYIKSFKLYSVDIPFKRPFKHAAASRQTSSSLFLQCTTDTGTTGFGECLPRSYVTGETRDGAFELLDTAILPRLIGTEFESFDQVTRYLESCDGKAPSVWLDPDQPQSAAWCAVDLALLDTFGRTFNEPVWLNDNTSFPSSTRYSVVISSDSGFKTLCLVRLMAAPQVKMKVEKEHGAEAVRRARKILGSKCDIRVDANMAWDVDEALHNMQRLVPLGVNSFEQPVAADDIDGLAELVNRSDLGVMVDESLSHRESLDNLIEKKACTAVNVRISKCGGLIAAHNRCRQALAAGLTIQVGCQVGESSLLSAAHLKLITAVREVKYAEGCFGRLLLREDPVVPLLQFGYRGKNPPVPTAPGLGVDMDAGILERCTTRSSVVQ